MTTDKTTERTEKPDRSHDSAGWSYLETFLLGVLGFFAMSISFDTFFTYREVRHQTSQLDQIIQLMQTEPQDDQPSARVAE